MRCPLDRVSLVLAAGAWMALAILVSPSFADECQCKKAAAAKAAAADHVDFFTIPQLERLPMVGRLFKAEAALCEDDGCAEKVERIGVDFDFCVGKLGECPLGLKTTACGKCCAEQSHVIAVTACSAEECAKECGAKCAKGECECPALAGKANACESTTCAAACEKGGCCPAVCAAKCAAGAGCDQACDEARCDVACCPQLGDTLARGPNTWQLWDHIAGLASENAALNVRLEAQEGREELLDQLVGLTAENAKLEAKVELAEAKLAMMQQMVELAVENKQLKAHAEALARQLQSHESAARTSQRTPVLTPAR